MAKVGKVKLHRKQNVSAGSLYQQSLGQGYTGSGGVRPTSNIGRSRSAEVRVEGTYVPFTYYQREYQFRPGNRIEIDTNIVGNWIRAFISRRKIHLPFLICVHSGANEKRNTIWRLICPVGERDGPVVCLYLLLCIEYSRNISSPSEKEGKHFEQ